MCGRLTVGAQYGFVEAGYALELALRTTAGVKVGAMRSCTDSAD